ncbi:hypothetical protein M0R04_09795 [Candidatus Dojkabacteria bacterium]|jgi:hypothetical protein|nr:hypothetical protein [Candidatus Dojkabacteria bacterium]
MNKWVRFAIFGAVFLVLLIVPDPIPIIDEVATGVLAGVQLYRAIK